MEPIITKDLWADTLDKFGVQRDIEIPSHINNLVEFLCERMNANKDSIGLIQNETQLTFEQINKLSSVVAINLSKLKLKKGSRIAVMLPNCIYYPVFILGILKCGCTVVNVNPLYTSFELNNLLEDSGAEVLICLEQASVDHFSQSLPLKYVFQVPNIEFESNFSETEFVPTISDQEKSYLKSEDLFSPSTNTEDLLFQNNVFLDDIAFLQYTGGTTGVSKGAMLSHRNIISNILQNAATMHSFLGDKKNIFETNLCVLPLYHIFSLTICLFTWGIYTGYANVLIANPRDLNYVTSQFKKWTPSLFAGVNTLFNALVHDKEFQQLDHSKLKLTTGGGASILTETAEKWKSITQQYIYEGYGLSETSPTVTTNLPQSKIFSATVGLPLPSTEIAIFDNQFNKLPINTEGEIAVKGPQVMQGYWNKLEDNTKYFTPDGYFLTGDIGMMDHEGYLRILDRKKDMILVSGFNVYPNEIEATLAKHPEILETAVIGIEDQKSGQAPKAFIVRKNLNLSEQEVLDFCKKYLTSYKCPKYIEFVTELPKSNVGKILRKDLRTAS